MRTLRERFFFFEKISNELIKKFLNLVKSILKKFPQQLLFELLGGISKKILDKISSVTLWGIREGRKEIA